MQDSLSHKNWTNYIIGLVGLVLLLLSSTKWATAGATNPYIWLISGLIFAFPIFNLTQPVITRSTYKWAKYNWILSLILLAIVGVLIYQDISWVIEKFADKADGSDVIPSLQVYVQRFLAGDTVYVAIPFENYSVLPTYFPAMWMPYIVPELLGIDYRWMAIGSFFILYSSISVYYISKGGTVIHSVLIALFPLLLVKWFVNYDVGSFIFATELMPLCFYMLLILGLTQKRIWLIGIAIALCTLSRYSYTLWIIPFIVVIWRACGFLQLLKIGVIGVSVILVLYVLPFLITDPSMFTDGLAYYGRTASDQWRTQSWQQAGEIPYHLNNGLSFSYHIFTSVQGDANTKLDFAKILNLIVSLFAALSIALFWNRSRKKIDWNDYLVISLFIYLLFFYSFLYVPFSYLFMLPLGLGITIFSIYGSTSIKYNQN